MNHIDRRTALIAGGAVPASLHPLVARAASKRIVLRVATLADDKTAAVYYAQELGSFSKYGLDVQPAPLTGGPAVFPASLPARSTSESRTW